MSMRIGPEIGLKRDLTTKQGALSRTGLHYNLRELPHRMGFQDAVISSTQYHRS